MLKSRIIYALSLIGAAMLAIGYQDTRAGFTILYALLLLSVFCGLSIALAPCLLKVEEIISEPVVFKGEPVVYTLAIRNRGPLLYPGMVCRFHNTGLMTMEGEPLGGCQPFRGQVREYAVSFPYRGIYTVGLQSVTVTDMFGIFTCTIDGQNALRLSVYPDQEEGFDLALRYDAQDAALRQDFFHEDYTTIADLRKYTPADSLRKIHWKLSAKRGELIAKNFQSFEPDRTILLLDTLKIDLPGQARAALEDKMISYIAASIACCARVKMPASLIYGQPGLDQAIVDPNSEADHFYPLLAGLSFDRSDSLVHQLTRLSGGYNLAVFLSKLDEAITISLKELLASDHKLIVYLFSSEDQPDDPLQADLAERLSASGASVHQVRATGAGSADDSFVEEGGAA